MDSLLASYASDDEEDQEENPSPQSVVPSPSSQPPPTKLSLFGRLPPPRKSASEAPSSGSLSAYLPPPHFQASVKLEQVSSSSDGESLMPRPGLFGKLPPPKVEPFATGYAIPNGEPAKPKPGLFAKLPAPKVEELGDTPSSKPSLFSALPPPMVEFDSSRVKLEIGSSNPKPKKQSIAFKPPIDVSILDDDDDDWRPAQKKAKPEPRSLPAGGGGLSSVLPAPKHSLGLGSALGGGASSGGRRAAMEVAARTSFHDVTVDDPVAVNSTASATPVSVKNEAFGSQFQVQYDNSAYAVDESASFEPQVQYSNEPYGWTAPQPAQEFPQPTHNVITSHYEQQNWQYVSGNASPYPSQPSYAPANSAAGPDPVAQVLQGERRRGREDRNAAPNVIEVKQADLTGGPKLREDQIRTTGIAFGPAYQPVSSKDKPSKVQRRKHQIGTLLQDSKAREMELLDRRAKGNLTKAETQAKYGW